MIIRAFRTENNCFSDFEILQDFNFENLPALFSDSMVNNKCVRCFTFDTDTIEHIEEIYYDFNFIYKRIKNDVQDFIRLKKLERLIDES